MGFLLYLHMKIEVEKDIIQSFIQDKIYSIDKVYESGPTSGDEITIEYSVRVLDQWTFPKSYRMSLSDYISKCREFKLNQILEDGTEEV